jgi:hypothetical protein
MFTPKQKAVENARAKNCAKHAVKDKASKCKAGPQRKKKLVCVMGEISSAASGKKSLAVLLRPQFVSTNCRLNKPLLYEQHSCPAFNTQ